MRTDEWSQVKRKFKKAVDQGMHFLKEGTEEARYVAGQTAHFIQLEVNIHSLKSRIEIVANQLGHEVQKEAKNGRLAMSPRIRELTSELGLLKAGLRKKETEIRHVSLVHKNGSSNGARHSR